MTTIELLSHLRSLGVKVWVDGERLRYSAPKGALTPDLLAQLAAQKVEIRSFLHETAAGRPTPPPIPPAPRDGPLPLSFAQQRLWFLDQLSPGLSGYNIPTSMRLNGRLDLAALRQSLNAIIERHEALRTTFTMVDGQPVQVIAAPAPLALPEVDLRALPPAKREAAARREAIAEAQKPFDLERGPLVRATLLRLAEDDYQVLFTLHHIIADAWSIGVLLRELAAFYPAYASDSAGPHHPVALLPPLSIQYADFAAWQRTWLQGDDVQAGSGDPGDSPLRQQLAYWRRQLGGHLPTLDLPTDRPRPPAQTFVGAIRPFSLGPDLTAALHPLSQREGATLFMTLLAAFQVLLYRYSGQTDILVGSPIAGRTRTEIEPLIGFFVNTLVLRGNLDGNPTVRELLGRIREVTLAAYAHQDLPFERLVEELRPERDLSRTPLFQVMFVLQNTGLAPVKLPGLTLRLQELETGTSKFDLLLALGEAPDGLGGEFEYNTDLFDAATIDRMIEHFRTLLEGIVANPEGRVSALPLLSAAEREQVLLGWNDTRTTDSAVQCCVHQLFERQVERAPGAIAVETPATATRMTFRELNGRANQLAHRLRSLGVGPDVRVGICMERSTELVIGILGILKAGGAYVPLDPAYPAERLQYMLEDAGIAVLLTTQEQRTKNKEQSATDRKGVLHTPPANEVRATHPAAHTPPANGEGVYRTTPPPHPGQPTVLDLLAEWETIAQQPATNPDSGATPDNLAYVIYTSGSTGRPKGVAMPHRALANLLSWQLRNFALPHPARTVQFSSPSFDVSFQEIFSTWCSGGTLVLVADELRRDPAALVRFMNDHSVERLFLPFVALQQLAEVVEQGPVPAHLREVITAGEQLRITPPIAAWLGEHEGRVLHNQYGPSESHVVTAYALHGPPQQWPALPPIGRPVANTQIYLLDAQMQPVPAGIPGELYIGGANLARGYLDRPDLTAERFVPNPFATTPSTRLRAGDDQRPTTDDEADASGGRWSAVSGRLYKTGDLARFLPDGNIEFLGRADTQVKVRGYRIEPGEIEAALEQHPGVHEAVVVAREDVPGTKRLVAYVVPNQEQRTKPVLSEVEGNKEQTSEKEASQFSILNSQFSGELRQFLRDRLPDYLIPAAFVPLESWPQTPSGKIDRRVLPVPDQTRAERQDSYLAPRDTLELEIARIWEQLLGVQPVGVRDSFFELGGHSLLVVRLMSRIKAQLGQSPPLSALFQEPTVEHLAGVLRGRDGSQPHSPLVGLRPAGSKKPFFCVHPGAGSPLCYVELAQHLDAEQPFYGLQAAGLEDDQPPRTRVEDMAESYVDALRAVQPEGPYLLGGWSFGGLVAYEMARRLHAQGQEVALLALLDSYAPAPDPEPAGDGAGVLAWFAYDLARRFGKEPPATAEDLRQISPERRLPFVLEQARAAGVLPPDIDEQQIQRALDVFAANAQAMHNYRPPTYPGRVTLLRAEERPPDDPQDPALGWGAFAAGGVEVCTVPGDHYTIVGPPHVQALAERLGACIAYSVPE